MPNKTGRKHYNSIDRKTFEANPHARLMPGMFVNAQGQDLHYYIQISTNCFQELSTAAFDITLERSKSLPVDVIKNNLEKFKEKLL